MEEGSYRWYEPEYKTGNLGEYISYLQRKWESDGKPHIDNATLASEYMLTSYGTNHAEYPGSIPTYYNPETNEIVVGAVKIQGGNVIINAGVINTFGGRIDVMDGFGQMEINNKTPYDLKLNLLDTGGTDLRGIEGTVSITDRNKWNNGYITTTYRRIGSDITVEESGWAWVGRDYIPVVFSRETIHDSRNTRYFPKQNLWYAIEKGMFGKRWVEGYLSASEFELFKQLHGDQWHQYIDSYAYMTNWESAGTKLKLDEWFEVEHNYYDREVVYKAIEDVLPYLTNEGHNINYYYLNDAWGEEPKWEYDMYHNPELPDGSFHQRWYLPSVEVREHIIFKADYDVQVNFIGWDEGSISVKSEGAVKLNNMLSSLKGQVTIDAKGGIAQVADDAVIRSEQITLKTGEGDIGSPLNPVGVQLTSDTGGLTAIGNNVYIRSDIGDLILSDIRLNDPSGIMRLETIGDISADPGLVLEGNRIELMSGQGSIGRAGNPIQLKAGSDGLMASAAHDIYLSQTEGDLYLGSALSSSGDVWLQVVDGSLIDANVSETRDERTEEELDKHWHESRLMDEGAQISAEETIAAYENARTREYYEYWQLRNIRPVYDEHGEVTGYEADPYDENHPNQRLHELHGRYGAEQFSPEWQYVATEQEREELTEGFEWTREQLETALSKTVLSKKTSSTVPVFEEPNIRGRNVVILVEQGSVGIDQGELIIDAEDPTVLQERQNRLALASAEANDVLVDEDSMLITVLLRDSVDVDLIEGGSLEVKARDHVYLGSQEPIYVKAVESGSDIRIKGKEGLYSVSGGINVISGHNLIIEGGTGGIGDLSNPIKLDLTPDSTVIARATEDIYLESLNGDLNVAEIFSRSGVFLSASGSIVNFGGERDYVIEGNRIELMAGGTVGHQDNVFTVVSGDGGVSVQAEADVYLRDFGTNVRINKLSAGGPVNYDAVQGRISILGDIKGGSLVSLRAAQALSIGSSGSIDGSSQVELAGTDLIMDDGAWIKAADKVTADFNGFMTLSSLEAGLVDLKADSHITQTEDGSIKGKLEVVAAGKIILDGLNNVAELKLENRGNGDTKFVNTSGDLSLIAAMLWHSGNIEITNAGGSISGETVFTEDGDISLTANGSILTDFTIASNGGISLTAETGSISAGYTQANDGDITFAAQGNIEISNILMTNKNVYLSSQGRIETTGNGRIQADLLDMVSSGSQLLLGDHTFASLKSRITNAGDLQINNTRSLTLQGIDVNEGDVLIQNTGDMTVGGVVSAGNGGSISLTSSNNMVIREQVGTTGEVSLSAGGSISAVDNGRIADAALLTTASRTGQTLVGDQVKAFTAVNTGSGVIQFANQGDLVVNRVAQVLAGDIIISGGNVSITDLIQTAGDIYLSAAGELVQDSDKSILTGRKLVTESGGSQLLTGANKVATFAGVISGAGNLQLQNLDSLVIKSITVADGDIDVNTPEQLEVVGEVSAGNTNKIQLTSGGNIQIVELVKTLGEVHLSSQGSITTADAGRIHAAQLTAISDGEVTFAGDNLVGRFAARSTDGAIRFSNLGTLQLLDLSTSDNIEINTADGLEILGTIDTTGEVSLTAAGKITETGQGRVINAAILKAVSGAGQELLGANSIEVYDATNLGHGPVRFANIESFTLKQLVQSSGDIELISRGDFDLGIDLATAGGSIRIDSGGGLVVGTDVTTGDGSIELSSGARFDLIGNVVSGGGDITLSSGGLFDLTGTVTTNSGNVLLNSIGCVLSGVVSTEDGDILLVSNGLVDLIGTVSSGDGNIELISGDSFDLSGNVRTSAGNILLSSNGGFALIGEVDTYDGNVLLNSGGQVGLSGDVSAGGIIELNSADRFDLSGTVITGSGDIKLNSDEGFDLSGDVTSGKGDIELSSGDRFELTGSVRTAGGNIVLSSGAELSLNGKAATGKGNILLNSGDSIDLAGTVTSGEGRIELKSADRFDLSGKVETAGGNITLYGGRGVFLVGDVVTASGNIALRSGLELVLTGSVVTDNGNIVVDSDDSLDLSGIVNSDRGDIELSSGGNFDLSGDVTANIGNIAINAIDGLYIGGAVSSVDGGRIELTTGGNLVVDGEIAATGTVLLNAVGAITELNNGRIVGASLLETRSGRGQALTGVNRVSVFRAVNTGTGAIQFVNSGLPLLVKSVIQEQAGEDIWISSASDIAVEQIWATAGLVELESDQGSITNANQNEAAVVAGDVILKAQSGSIGSEEKLLVIDSGNGSNGSVTANAKGNIAIAENSGDFAAAVISSAEGDLIIMANGSIISASSAAANERNFSGVNIDLLAQNGSIGTAANRVSASAVQVLNAKAKGNIFLDAVNGLTTQMLVSELGSINLYVTGGRLDAELIEANAGLTVAADDVAIARLVHTGDGSLGLAFTGVSNEMADNVVIRELAGRDIQVERLIANFSSIISEAERIRFDYFDVGTYAYVASENNTVAIDSVVTKLRDVSLQLYSNCKPFNLLLNSNRKVETSALVINCDRDYTINGVKGGISIIAFAQAIMHGDQLPSRLGIFPYPSVFNLGVQSLISFGQDIVSTVDDEEDTEDDEAVQEEGDSGEEDQNAEQQ